MPRISETRIDFFEDIRKEIGKDSYMGSLFAINYDPAEADALTRLCMRISFKLDLMREEVGSPELEVYLPNGNKLEVKPAWPPPTVREPPPGFPHWISANLIVGPFDLVENTNILVYLKQGGRRKKVGSLPVVALPSDGLGD